MLIFQYEARSFDGAKKNGSLVAQDYKEAFEQLRLQKFHPTYIREKKVSSKRVKAEDLLLLFMHIDFQLKCCISINKAIESFVDFHFNKNLNATLNQILLSLKKGIGLSEAFESCSEIFGDVISGLLKAADKTGKLGIAVSNILNFLKLQEKWKKDIKRALLYPSFLLVISLLILLFCLSVLGPQISDFYRNLPAGQSMELYPLTKLALAIPNYYKEIFLFFILGLIFVLASLANYKMRIYLLNKAIAIPKFGDLIAKIIMWKACKVIQIGVGAKLEFLNALDLAISSMNLKKIKTEFEKARLQILDGYSVSIAFANIKYMPRDILTAIYVGEDSNNLEGAFDHITSSIYNDILYKINILGKSLSISFTIFTGLIYIFILCSLIYPVYDFIEVMGR